MKNSEKHGIWPIHTHMHMNVNRAKHICSEAYTASDILDDYIIVICDCRDCINSFLFFFFSIYFPFEYACCKNAPFIQQRNTQTFNKNI